MSVDVLDRYKIPTFQWKFLQLRGGMDSQWEALRQCVPRRPQTKVFIYHCVPPHSRRHHHHCTAALLHWHTTATTKHGEGRRTIYTVRAVLSSPVNCCLSVTATVVIPTSRHCALVTVDFDLWWFRDLSPSTANVHLRCALQVIFSREDAPSHLHELLGVGRYTWTRRSHSPLVVCKECSHFFTTTTTTSFICEAYWWVYADKARPSRRRVVRIMFGVKGTHLCACIRPFLAIAATTTTSSDRMQDWRLMPPQLHSRGGRADSN
ncbi:hypothetical protein TcWFU_006707 [Taenia crassiceps]|uniref:Uncharacterized protein n=1 Tax=Taenia crassiceps TaxID=6207 RepID=A0ABR4Q087_9CEST